MDLVVQHQRVIALAPVVADALAAIDDERVDAECGQPRGGRKSGVAAADDEHRGIAIGIGRRRVPDIEPVRSAEIARIGLCGRCGLPVRRDLVESRQQRPGFKGVAIVGVGPEPHHTAASSVHRLKRENCFDRVGAGAHHVARRCAARRDPEIVGPRLARVLVQTADRGVAAFDRCDPPGQRQHVTPITIRVEQLAQIVGVDDDGLLELCQPVLDDDGKGVRSG